MKPTRRPLQLLNLSTKTREKHVHCNEDPAKGEKKKTSNEKKDLEKLFYWVIRKAVTLSHIRILKYYKAKKEMNLGKLWEIVRDREAWCAYSPRGPKESDTT